MDQTPTLRLPPAQRYRFRFRAEEPIHLPGYAGSAWRGLLGHGLRRVACVTRADDCGGCPLAGNCVYERVFETREGGGSAPHPFVLQVETAGERPVPAGSILQLGMTLLGPHRQTLPYLAQALEVAGRRGLGRTRGGRFRLEGLHREDGLGTERWLEQKGGECAPPAEPPPAPARAVVELLTPLRMKEKGHLVGTGEFTAGHFLRQLWRRLRGLERHCADSGADLHLPMPALRADQVRLDGARLNWRDWERYSSRQNRRLKMGGLLGHWSLSGEGLRQWWPLLWYGQWVHIGRGTSLGLGRYRIAVPAAPEEGAAE